MIVVVDASVAVKWYVDEDHTAEAEQLIDGHFDLQAPELMLAEFGNILWKKFRNNEVDEKTVDKAITMLGQQKMTLHSHSGILKPAVFGAVETGTSVYDWLYLSLSIALDCPFVTADRRFFIALRNTRFRQRTVWVENISTLE